MARYIKDFQYSGSPQMLFDSVYNFLSSEKFEYQDFDGENVFKKGEGFLVSPCFFKLTFSAGLIRLETWSKYTIIPGVFVGEFGTTGFVGSAVRGPWLKRLATVESIIASLGGIACAQPVIGVFEQTASPVNSMPYQTSAPVCTNCGNPAPPNSSFCSVCGAPVEQGQSINTQNISRKEFIEKYLPQSDRRSINSVAYVCYFCAALTAVLCLALHNPWGLIDAGILFAIALGMQLTKNRGFSILLLIFSIFEFVLTILAGGYPPMWWLAAGIAAVVIFSKIEKKYKQFKGQN